MTLEPRSWFERHYAARSQAAGYYYEAAGLGLSVLVNPIEGSGNRFLPQA